MQEQEPKKNLAERYDEWCWEKLAMRGKDINGLIATVFVGLCILVRVATPKPESTTSIATAPTLDTSYSSPDSSLSSRDKVAADILAVACGNQVGLVAYDAIGGQLKELLEGDGINPEEVHSNWDYYYSRAKEMDAIKGYGCIR